jgi:outer membrane protein OmpA-like peptidoglycan-associated protein
MHYMSRLFLFGVVFIPLTINAQNKELRKSIYFGGGSYGVGELQTTELYHWLDSVPNLLQKYDIHLISHTDPIGGKEYNEWLSRMRSEMVRSILLQKGIPETKITMKNWGLENPVYSNDNFVGMEMNRRVDVILYPVLF